MSKLSRFSLLVTVLTLAVGAAVADDMARVRVVHASPDAPSVDIVVNDGPRLFRDLGFGMATDYRTVPANVYNVKVTPAGAPPSGNVIDADLSLFYNTDYTVVAVGELESIRPIVLVDDNSPLARGQSRLRFVHASPDAPAVDIKVVDGPFLFQNVAFTQVGDYVTIPEGIYGLEVRLAGTDTVVLDLPGIDFESGTTYTAYATGFAAADGPALGVLVSADSRGFVGIPFGPRALLQRGR